MFCNTFLFDGNSAINVLKIQSIIQCCNFLQLPDLPSFFVPVSSEGPSIMKILKVFHDVFENFLDSLTNLVRSIFVELGQFYIIGTYDN